MKFIIERESLLKPLQQIIRPLGNHPTLQILSHVLLKVTKDRCLLLTSTDLEVEIVVSIILDTPYEPGSITVPGRKLFDIFRSFPGKSKINVTTLKNNQMQFQFSRSCFFLSTLPSHDFPNLDDWQFKLEFTISKNILKALIESTYFSIAHQDVRYYLNGMLLEIVGTELRTVTSDGHRLSFCLASLNEVIPSCSIIIPRKGVTELIRILNRHEHLITLQIGNNHIRAIIGNYMFTSKLIEGNFPNYRNVLPKNLENIMEGDCYLLNQAFSRSAILSHEKLHVVQLHLNINQLKISSQNSKQEKYEEILDVMYQGKNIEIGFNVHYILDVLNVLKCRNVRFLLTDGISGMQIEDCDEKTKKYVIMPIHL